MNDVRLANYRLVARVALLQLGCGVLVALGFWVTRGVLAGVAALAGSCIVVVGTALLGWRMFKPGIAGAVTLTTAMYGAVALKWLWFAVALTVALGLLRLPAAPLLIGLAVAQLGYWLGLAVIK